MINFEAVVKSLTRYTSEEEWFEFKENWCEPHVLGEYISAISNAAAMKGRDAGYFIWGVHNDTHEIVGTNFKHQQEFKNEPLEHYLARLTAPDIGFKFHDLKIDGHSVVVLEIPAAVKVPTSFDHERYIRIGSSKESVAKYPEREAQLFDIVNLTAIE